MEIKKLPETTYKGSVGTLDVGDCFSIHNNSEDIYIVTDYDDELDNGDRICIKLSGSDPGHAVAMSYPDKVIRQHFELVETKN